MGVQVMFNRILLGWCAVTVLFLAYFVALKNFQYMLPLALPPLLRGSSLPGGDGGAAHFEMAGLLQAGHPQNCWGDHLPDVRQPVCH